MKNAAVLIALATLAPLVSLVAFGSEARTMRPPSAVNLELGGEPDRLAVRAEADGSIGVTTHGETLHLQTRTPATDLANAHLDTDGQLTVARGDVTERWAQLPSRRGFEQSWTYAHRPNDTRTNDGALVVRVDARGLAYRGQDAHGLIFGDARHRVRYGRATWVDARGTKTEVAERFEGGAIALEVPRDVLDRSAYPATLDPTLVDEGDIDPTFAASFASSSGAAAVVTNGTFFVVQQVNRGYIGVHVDPATALPVPADGNGIVVVGTQPITSSLSVPALAYDGASTMAVAWTEESSVDQTTSIALYISFLDGVTGLPKSAADAAGRVVENNIGQVRNLSLGWDSAHFLASWVTDDSSETLTSLRIDSTGAALAADGNGVPLATGLFAEGGLSIACSPSGCLYGWSNLQAAYLGYYDPTSGTLAKTITVGNFVTVAPGVAWDPAANRYFAVSSSGSYTGRFLGPSATSAAIAGSPFTIKNTFQPQGPWSLTFDGTQFVGVSNGTFAAFSATIAAGGGPTVHKNVVAVTDPYQSGPIVAATAGVTLLAYVPGDEDSGGPSVAVCVNAASGAIAAADADATHTGVVLSRSENNEYDPIVVSSAAGTWAAWGDDRSAGDLYSPTASAVGVAPYVAAVDPETGHVLEGGFDPSAPPASDTTDSDTRLIVTDGASAIVVNADSVAVRLARIAVDGSTVGSVVTSDPVPTGGAFPVYALAYGGGHLFLAAFGDSQVFARVLDSATLTPIAPWTLVASAGPNANLQALAVASDGTDALVTWIEPTGDPLLFDIDGARVGPDGTVLDATPVSYASRLGAGDMAVAYGDGEYLIIWTDQNTDKSSGDLSGILVQPGGAAIGSVLSIAPGDVNTLDSTAVTSAADGVNFVVAWRTPFGGALSPQIKIGLVGIDGTVRQPDGFVVSDGSENAAGPSITSLAPGELLLVYNVEDSSNVSRIDVAHVSTGLASGKCTANADCATLACFDGFCCDRSCGGTCETCAAVPGKCTSVQSAPDPDTCSGSRSCDSAGVCTENDAQGCASAADCASGHCVDGVCCDSACEGSCAACNVVPGKCTTLASGNAGSAPSCAPYVCDGASASCPSGCKTDDDCARPYTCAATGACELLTGAACTDHETLQTANAALVKCSPYACHGEKCSTTCGSIDDCADGFVCDGDGQCVDADAPTLAGGCTSGGRGGRESEDAWCALVFAIGITVTLRARRRRT